MGGGEGVNGGRGLAGGLNIARGGEEPAFELSGLSKELGWKGSGTSYNRKGVSRDSYSQGAWD